MKRLILLRHAKSDWSGPLSHDKERPLNKRGKSAASMLGSYIRIKQLKPDLVFCSSATRTRETWKQLQKASGLLLNANYIDSLYGGNINSVLSLIRSISDPHCSNVMIVGHNPCIQETALELNQDCESVFAQKIEEKVPTGSLITLDFDIQAFAHVSLNTGKITNFIRPKHELIAALNSKKTKL
ncbi:MAG: histidine phosphatase family protein [Kordiimonas sp.]